MGEMRQKTCPEDVTMVELTAAQKEFIRLVPQLEIGAIDTECERLRDDPECPQAYGCIVVGTALTNPEGACAEIEIHSGEGREYDEWVGRFLVVAAKLAVLFGANVRLEELEHRLGRNPTYGEPCKGCGRMVTVSSPPLCVRCSIFASHGIG